MSKLREAGIFGVLGFLAGTLLPIAIWKTDAGSSYILSGGSFLPYLLSPTFALLGTVFMAGYVNFKEKFITVDPIDGTKAYSAFWLILIIMQILGVLVALEAVMEA
jgi:hypothetical protein